MRGEGSKSKVAQASNVSYPIRNVLPPCARSRRCIRSEASPRGDCPAHRAPRSSGTRRKSARTPAGCGSTSRFGGLPPPRRPSLVPGLSHDAWRRSGNVYAHRRFVLALVLRACAECHQPHSARAGEGRRPQRVRARTLRARRGGILRGRARSSRRCVHRGLDSTLERAQRLVEARVGAHASTVASSNPQ